MQAVVDVSAAVAGALDTDRVDADGLVELPRAPGPGQAIVDLDVAAVTDSSDAGGDLADRLARRLEERVSRKSER